MKGRIVVLILLAAACGRKRAIAGGGGETETINLGDSGFVIDVPKGWSLESTTLGFYKFKDGDGETVVDAPSVMEAPGMEGPGGLSFDDAVKAYCQGRTDVTHETLPNSGIAMTCKGEKTTKVVVHIPNGRGGLDCLLDLDRDPEPTLAFCKSIRKK